MTMRPKTSASVFLLVLLNYFVNVTCFARLEGSDCTIDSKPGVCRKISECSSAWTKLVCQGVRPRTEDVCNNSKREQEVCCPRSDPPIRQTKSCFASRMNMASVDIVDATYPVAKSNEMCAKFSTSEIKQVRATGEDEDRDVSQHLNRVARSEGSLLADNEDEDGYGPRITNGKRANSTEFPHMAAVGYESDAGIKWACGGTLISERFVLTAGHCLWNRATGSFASWVQLGNLALDSADPATRYAIAETIAHPDYHPPALYNDLALLRLDRDVTFGRRVRPACLQTDRVDEGLTCTATGWGITNIENRDLSNELQKVMLQVQRSADCNSSYSELIKTGRKLIDGIRDESTICAGDVVRAGGDTCQGDSGGPIQVKLNNTEDTYSVIGVTSFGMSACGTGHPALYTRVSYFVPWIVSHLWPPIGRPTSSTTPKTPTTWVFAG